MTNSRIRNFAILALLALVALSFAPQARAVVITVKVDIPDENPQDVADLQSAVMTYLPALTEVQTQTIEQVINETMYDELGNPVGTNQVTRTNDVEVEVEVTENPAQRAKRVYSNMIINHMKRIVRQYRQEQITVADPVIVETE